MPRLRSPGFEIIPIVSWVRYFNTSIYAGELMDSVTTGTTRCLTGERLGKPRLNCIPSRIGLKLELSLTRLTAPRHGNKAKSILLLPFVWLKDFTAYMINLFSTWILWDFKFIFPFISVQELKKHTSPAHKDFQTVKQALETMKDVASLINERKRKVESINKIAKWQSTIEGWEVS